jgi:hypothetical protein
LVRAFEVSLALYSVEAIANQPTHCRLRISDWLLSLRSNWQLAVGNLQAQIGNRTDFAASDDSSNAGVLYITICATSRLTEPLNFVVCLHFQM